MKRKHQNEDIKGELKKGEAKFKVKVKSNNGNVKNIEAIKPDAKEKTDGKEPTYWLMKSEPETRLVSGVDVKFSIDDLKDSKDSTTGWEGVRNYEARNFMRDEMKLGDLVLFYHSNCKTPGVVGLAKVVKEGYLDETATDPEHHYFDKKRAGKGENVWFKVDVKFVEKFKNIVSLKILKSDQHKPHLSDFSLLKRAQLSVHKVSKKHFDYILELANNKET